VPFVFDQIDMHGVTFVGCLRAQIFDNVAF
jgi:hypothetical protein